MIRKIQRNEAFLIHRLAQGIWPEAFAAILSKEQTGYMLQMMYAVEVLEKEMDRGVEFYMLNIDGEDAGYTAIERIGDNAYKLHKIYLSKKLHGTGLGKFQLQSMERIVKDYGALYLYLNVNRHNKAVGFYQSQGYEIIKEEDIDIGNGYFMNDYVMRKQLNHGSFT